MARFDVYANPGPQSKTTPWLVDVQSDLLDDLDTRMVVPLRLAAEFPAVKLPARLTPVLHLKGKDCVLETPKMAAVPLRALSAPLASLAVERERITAALDFLFHGY